MTDIAPNVMPSATPTDAEIAAWEALPRDEQLARLRHALSDPACATVSTASMSDVRAAAQARAAKARNA